MKERNVNTIIQKSLTANTCEEASNEGRTISARLLGSEIAFTDTKCVNVEKHIFRAKILDDKHRGELFSKAKILKDIPECSNLFIHRDLTYNQRQVLFERRAAARSASNLPREQSPNL